MTGDGDDRDDADRWRHRRHALAELLGCGTLAMGVEPPGCPFAACADCDKSHPTAEQVVAYRRDLVARWRRDAHREDKP